MGWFDFGGGDKNNSSSNSDSLNLDFAESSSSSEFASPRSSASNQYSSQMSRGGSGNFEQDLMKEQENILYQAITAKLTDLAFDTCVTKPSTSLSYKENACITAFVGKYLDTSKLVVGRIFQGK